MIVRASEIDALTHSLGREMFARMRGSRPWVFQAEWWEERLMQQCMGNERLKVQAFRFIDALPMIMHDDKLIAQHLREYFAALVPSNGSATTRHRDRRAENRAALAELESDRGDGLLRWLSGRMNFQRLDEPRARFFAFVARRASQAMAARFIAGSNIRDVGRAILRLRQQRMAFSVDVLGETAISRAECDVYAGVYDELITELPRQALRWKSIALIDSADGQPIPRINVSVKLSSLHAGLDAIAPDDAKRVLKERLRPLLRKGIDAGAHVHIDTEHYAIKDITLAICREIFMEREFRDYPHLGVVLQAYLRDCERDVAETIDWARRRGTPIWVRLVKGAYWDTETVLAEQRHWPYPVWGQKWESDACFERVSRTLLQNHAHTRVAVASHNIRSLAHAMALKRLWDIPSSDFELQMLFGMGNPIKRAVVAMGERCRVYTPYGELIPGMAYLIRRLLENTANESFLAHSVNDDTPEEELLSDPEEIGRATPPPAEPIVLRYEFEEPVMDPFENVANTDFTREPNRQEMLSGLAHARKNIGGEQPLVIGGRRVTTDVWAESRNPSRPAEVVGKIAQADEGCVDRAVEAAGAAFREWRRVAPHERAELLFRAADIMQARRFELAALETVECGKPWREADADVSEAIDYCNYHAKEMIRISEHRRRRDIAGETNEYFYTPRGVVAVISPWNFPLALLTGMTAAGLVTGNTVVMKPAQQAACVAARLMDVFEEADLPAGVLNYLPGPGTVVGEALVRHRHVAMIAFTGSRDVGCRINRLAAEVVTAAPALKKVLVEMGGKNAVIVDSDAELGAAVTGIIGSAFSYAGQKCTACSRVIVLDEVHDRFVERLVEAARTLRIGPGDEPTTFVSPLIDQAAFDSVREFIRIGKSEATCALEVDASEPIAKSGGYFVGPVIFTNVPPEARIAREEIFGPVLSVVRARDIDHAIDIFSGTDYALTGGIYSRSPANIERARRECECGNFYINRKITGSAADLQPFGGLKMSGSGGRVGGPDYLIQFCQARTITETTLRRGFAPSEEVAKAVG